MWIRSFLTIYLVETENLCKTGCRYSASSNPVVSAGKSSESVFKFKLPGPQSPSLCQVFGTFFLYITVLTSFKFAPLFYFILIQRIIFAMPKRNL